MMIKPYLNLNIFIRNAGLAIFVAAFLLAPSKEALNAKAQSQGANRDRGREMLNEIKEDLIKNYYDQNFHGMNVESRFKAADDRIKVANSNSEIFGIIAQVLADLNDSHTFFVPPSRVSRVDYGWDMQIIGDTCYVVAVKPNSDAALKKLKLGDVIHTVDGIIPTRENLWKIHYLYYTLSPKTGMSVVVKDANGGGHQLNLASEITEGEELDRQQEQEYNNERKRQKAGTSIYRSRFYEAGPDLMICKMPSFEMSEESVNKMMKKIAPYKSLILDLRGNGGGNEPVLKQLIGYFFDRKLKIGDLKERDKIKTLESQVRKDNIYTGQVVVLVDSESASAAEVFARIIQLEKRGTVIGDRTPGVVMRGRVFYHGYGRGVYTMKFSSYAALITVSDLIMTDGKSLERLGVTPDEISLPSANDLAERRDPVLARAAALFGVNLDSAKAGSLFPMETGMPVEAESEKKKN